ncbi:hypothetical protein EDB81DRAFT_730716, partial [Dactylonectria macrodidyma]
MTRDCGVAKLVAISPRLHPGCGENNCSFVPLPAVTLFCLNPSNRIRASRSRLIFTVVRLRVAAPLDLGMASSHFRDAWASSPSGGGNAHKARRACVDCNRKKTKCDMTLPSCHLCSRTNTPCLYPSRRKKRTVKSRTLVHTTTLQNDVTHHFGTILSTGMKLQYRLLLTTTAEHIADMETASNQGHDVSEGGFAAPNNSNRQEYVLPVGSDAVLNNLGNTHPALLETTSLDNQYLNHSNSANSFVDLELGQPEISMENQPRAILDTLSIPWDSQCFWAADGPATASQTDRLCQGSPDNGLNTDSPDRSVHTVSTADAAISSALLEELVTLYFNKVHCFVPILHRPRFYDQYFSGESSISDDDAARLLRGSLILNAMLALAARFSSDPQGSNPLH